MKVLVAFTYLRCYNEETRGDSADRRGAAKGVWPPVFVRAGPPCMK